MEFYQGEIDRLTAEHGVVPPPWFEFPETHPVEICWRMGSGESYLMFFHPWWKQKSKEMDESQKIEYFRRFPPPPRYLEWMIEWLWQDEESEAAAADATDFDYDFYFARAEEFGFGSKEDYERDFNEYGQEDEDGDEDDDADEDEDEDEDEDDKKDADKDENGKHTPDKENK